MPGTAATDAVTEGQRLLRTKLRPLGTMSQKALADLFSIKQSSVSLWASGRSRPEPHHRAALEVLWGIPQDTWMTAEEAEIVKRVQAAAPSSPPPASSKKRKAPKPRARVAKRRPAPLRPAA